MTKRKIIQIAYDVNHDDDGVFSMEVVLCDDGTVWHRLIKEKKWIFLKYFQEIPDTPLEDLLKE